MVNIETAFHYIDADLNDGDERPSFSGRDSKWGMYTIKFIDIGVVALYLLDRNIILFWRNYLIMQKDINANNWVNLFIHSPINHDKSMDASYLPCRINAKLLTL